VLEMGDEAVLEGGATAYLRTARLDAPTWRAQALDYDQGVLVTRLVRATEEEREVIVELEGQGKTMAADLPGPGAYRVEASVKPLHLKPALFGVKHLAVVPYPYLYSNAVFLRAAGE